MILRFLCWNVVFKMKRKRQAWRKYDPMSGFIKSGRLWCSSSLKILSVVLYNFPLIDNSIMVTRFILPVLITEELKYWKLCSKKTKAWQRTRTRANTTMKVNKRAQYDTRALSGTQYIWPQQLCTLSWFLIDSRQTAVCHISVCRLVNGIFPISLCKIVWQDYVMTIWCPRVYLSMCAR